MIIKLWTALLAPAGDPPPGSTPGTPPPGAPGAPGSSQTPPGSATPPGTPPAPGAPGSQTAPPAANPSILNERWEFSEGWQNQLPDDQFADLKPVLSNFRDLSSLGKALKDNMAAARAKTDGMVKIPTPPATDAKPEDQERYKTELAAYHRAVGVPEKPEDYGLKAPEKPLEGVQWNDAHAAEFAKVALNLGLTPAQAQALSEFQMGLTSQQYQQNLVALQAYDKEQDATILKAFGAQPDKAMVDVRRACMTLFGTQELPADRASLVIGLAKLATLVSEDKLVSTNSVKNMLGPKEMAREIQMDPTSPFNNPGHPKHEQQKAEVERLMRAAYPEK